jgi:hypothetical protein
VATESKEERFALAAAKAEAAKAKAAPDNKKKREKTKAVAAMSSKVRSLYTHICIALDDSNTPDSFFYSFFCSFHDCSIGALHLSYKG